MLRSKSEIPVNIKHFTIVLADSTLHFKIKSDSFMEINDNDSLQAPINLETIRRKQIDTNGLVLRPNAWYKFVFTADDFNFTENEEISVTIKIHLIIQCSLNLILHWFMMCQIYRLEMAVGLDKHQVTLCQSSTLNTTNAFKSHNSQLNRMDNIVVHSSCYIVPT